MHGGKKRGTTVLRIDGNLGEVRFELMLSDAKEERRHPRGTAHYDARFMTSVGAGP